MGKDVAQTRRIIERRKIRPALYICFFWIMFFDQPALSQSPQAPDSISISYRRLTDVNKRLLTIGTNLFQISRSLDRRDTERDIVADLQESVNRTINFSTHAMDVLFLYQKMSLKNREDVREEVRKMLEDLVIMLGHEIKVTDGALANTKRPGITDNATQLKNAIRQTIDALNGAQL